MKLYIAGGCGEHGRNCFLLEDNGQYLMVDCGKGDNDVSFPQLTKEEIMKTEYLFLTHSHKDHSGGIQWMMKQGFHGSIISTEETRIQCNIDNQNWRFLPVSKKHLPLELNENLRVSWGRSGHCVGSVWYLIEWNSKQILFTGDYEEKSPFYYCDKIRNVSADCAVIDCAYGNQDMDRSKIDSELIDAVCNSIEEAKTLMLPVPKYGRGLEIIRLLSGIEKNFPIYVDHNLSMQISTKNALWTDCMEVLPRDIEKWRGEPAVLLVSDPQLRKKDNYKFAVQILNAGGTVLLTGHIYPNTGSEYLLVQKLAKQIIYPVHMNYRDVCSFISKNKLHNIVLNHHLGKIVDKEKITSDIKTGDIILF